MALVTLFCAVSLLDVTVTPADSSPGCLQSDRAHMSQVALSKLLDVEMIMGAFMVNTISQRRLNPSFMKGRQAFKSVRAL